MILLVHLLLGALIGQKITSPILAIFLAFLSHYLLDIIPHTEYSIENIKNKNLKKSFFDIIKIFFDFFIGIIFIIVLSNNQPIIYICAFFAILPDAFSVINIFFKIKFLNTYSNIHQEKLHFLRNKKISIFWRLFSQIIIVVLSIYFLISY